MSDSFRLRGLQHARLPCLLSPGVCSSSCPLSQWCRPTISSSVVPFSPCPRCFPASGSFSMSRLFTSGGQSIGASVSASVLPVNMQDWSPLSNYYVLPDSPIRMQTLWRQEFFKIYLFLSIRGLCCCLQPFFSCGEWGLLFIAVASLVAEYGLCSWGTGA